MAFVDIPAPHGRLEAFLWEVENPVAQVVVCHPHPKHGGTLHNHVTYRVADAFRQAGVTALRFNFRGVGRSTGTYDEGRGEYDDGMSALNFLAGRNPHVPLYTAGFSFGSRVSLRLAVEDARVQKTLAVGIAVELFDYNFALGLEKKKAFIHADQDEFATLDQVRAFMGQLPDPKRLFVVDNSDHLCTGRLDAFAVQAKDAVRWLLE